MHHRLSAHTLTVTSIDNPTPAARWWTPLAYGLVCSVLWVLSWAVIFSDSAAQLLSPISAFAAAAIGVLAVRPNIIGDTRKRLALKAALFGLGHAPALALGHLYIWKTAGPTLLLLVAYLALFPAVALYIAVRLHRRWPRLPTVATVPFLWVALEVVRGEWLVGGYPWYLVGHAATRPGGASWLAPIIGAYGCSLVLVAVACAVNDLLGRSGKVAFAGVAAVIASGGLSLALGPRAAEPPQRTFRVAVLQTNLPQDNKLGWAIGDRVEAHKRWLALSEAAAAGPRRPQLIVWPETMFAGVALNPEAIDVQRRAGLTYTVPGSADPLAATWFADTLIALQVRVRTPLLVGSIAADGLAYAQTEQGVKTTTAARANSAILVADGGPQQARYDKVNLMAFGEYIPVAYRWPSVQQWLAGIGAQGMAFDLAFGRDRTLFNVEGVRIGTPICFESCHQSANRAFTTNADGSRRADLLINLTNDGWFYGSDFNRRMHLLQCRWRCAELETPMVRAANTGISCVIDSAGRVLTTALDDGRPLLRNEGVVSADVPLPLSLSPATPMTFFARIGHHLTTVIVACGGVLAVLAFWPARRPQPGSAQN